MADKDNMADKDFVSNIEVPGFEDLHQKVQQEGYWVIPTEIDMEKIKIPVAIKEWQKQLKSIRQLMANPYCDHQMFLSLKEKEKATEKAIKKLKQK